MAAVECRQQVPIDDMAAAGGIDQRRTGRQHGQKIAVDEAVGRGGERQQADQDFRSREQRRQSVGGLCGLFCFSCSPRGNLQVLNCWPHKSAFLSFIH